MSHVNNTNKDDKEEMSTILENIFQRYTIIPSSVADEEEIDELRESFENLDTDAHENGTGATNDITGVEREGEIIQAHNTNPILQQGSSMEQASESIQPGCETQLSQTQYARKTIQKLLETLPNFQPINELSESSDDEKPALPMSNSSDIGQPSCERCFMLQIECEPNMSGRGIACQPCRLKRRRCSLVPEKPQKPGARGTSTDASTIEYSEGTDSKDESFELDGFRVTLQRVFGKVSYLLKGQESQEKRFEKLEAQLKRVEDKLDLVLEKLNNAMQS